jgi:hypothetical protein
MWAALIGSLIGAGIRPSSTWGSVAVGKRATPRPWAVRICMRLFRRAVDRCNRAARGSVLSPSARN